jgi:glycosyltransferase involved in cell wall biosynthesis
MRRENVMTRPEENPARANSISVIFPSYNEQDNIRGSYASATAVLRKLGFDYEIIFVDDGSTDATPQIADELAATDQHVKAIHHPANLGYGAALKSGFATAAKMLVFYTDCDGQFDLNELPPLIPLIRNCDVVSCFRMNRQDGWVRSFNAFCWNKLVGLLFGLKLRDINCAFKLYKRKVFHRIELHSTGALISTEILAKATTRGWVITQVGVHHFPRTLGKPTGAKPRVILRAFAELIQLRRQLGILAKPAKASE